MSIKGHLITYIGLALFDDDDNNNNTYSFSGIKTIKINILPWYI